MGLLDRLRAAGTPRLASTASDAPVVTVVRLAVHTAEAMVIVELSSDAAAPLRAAAADTAPVTLTCSTAPEQAAQTVYFVPSKRDELPVRDPKRGWVLPLPPAARRDIVNLLSEEPGDYEISDRLALCVISKADFTRRKMPLNRKEV